MVTAEEKAQQRQKAKEWSRRFQTFTNDTWQAAGAVVHEASMPTFTVESMKAEQKVIWTQDKDSQKLREGWKATCVGKDIPKSTVSQDWLPSKQEAFEAFLKASGAAGVDGWTSAELKLVLRTFPFLFDELYETWCETTKAAGRGQLEMSLKEQ
eukprot:5685557-Karenia_brevis.AAC.1